MPNHVRDFVRDASFRGVSIVSKKSPNCSPDSVLHRDFSLRENLDVSSRRLDSVPECVETWSESFQEAVVSRLQVGITWNIQEATVSRRKWEDFSLTPTVSDPFKPCISFSDAGLLESWFTLSEFFSLPCNEEPWFTIMLLCRCNSITIISWPRLIKISVGNLGSPSDWTCTSMP